MKHIALIILSVLFYGNVLAQWGGNNATLSSGKEAEIKWEQKIIDLGEIKQYHPAEVIFKFKNTGGKPIIITNAEGSCGCTDIDYPKKPVLPGETAKIIVTYDAELLGVFNKTVTLTVNIEKSKQILHIKGTVVK
ncbi:MAG: DUF1573 domain-containing protein [Chlorobi bacterium]|nr:DUF1573 domain-containing protein [Chlorobiota bacterium]